MASRLSAPLIDNRLGSMVRAPEMNHERRRTTLARVDPLKSLFRNLFELVHPHARGHVVAFLGEFLGTLIFIFLAFAGVETAGASSNVRQAGDGVSTAPPQASPSQLLYVALSAGFALAVTAWTFFRISGGLFNPVISLGMALIGAITWARCALLIVAQTVATICASYIVYALFNGGLNVTTKLGGGTSPAQGVVIEMLLTAQLAFTIFMLAAEHHDGTYLAPVGIGLSLFIAELVGVFWTGGSLNPARSLAPCIVNRSFPSYHWIYYVGPISGVILAVLVYKLVKALEYENVNGDDRHDDDDDDDEINDVVQRQIDVRRPSSLVVLASAPHSEYESIRTTGQQNRNDSIQLTKPARKDSMPKPTSTNRPARSATQSTHDEKKEKEKVEELPTCFAD